VGGATSDKTGKTLLPSTETGTAINKNQKENTPNKNVITSTGDGAVENTTAIKPRKEKTPMPTRERN
jgi:hypothetical protein